MVKRYAATINNHAMHLVQELRQLENHTTNNLGEILNRRVLMLFCGKNFFNVI